MLCRTHVSSLLAATKDSTDVTEPLLGTRMFISGLNFSTDDTRVSTGVLCAAQIEKIYLFGPKKR